jgi:hypothetical protein
LTRSRAVGIATTTTSLPTSLAREGVEDDQSLCLEDRVLPRERLDAAKGDLAVTSEACRVDLPKPTQCADAAMTSPDHAGARTAADAAAVGLPVVLAGHGQAVVTCPRRCRIRVNR